MRIGVHVSIAGKIYESVERAAALGCDTMQIFSRNPRGWAVSSLAADDVAEFKKRRALKGIFPVVVHIPYLINLATPDDHLYQKSIDAYMEDVRRADLLGAEFFVTHLGSHTGSGEEQGVRRFSDALNLIIGKVRPKTMILLEMTAGSGSWLGYRFEHLREMLGNLKERENVGICFDTAHVFEAGYDIKSKEGLEDALNRFETVVGKGLIKVVHFNDSLTGLSSHADRHAHIGKGRIGLAALARVINHPKLKDAAFIMETPKKSDKDDRMNLAVARRISGRRKGR